MPCLASTRFDSPRCDSTLAWLGLARSLGQNENENGKCVWRKAGREKAEEAGRQLDTQVEGSSSRSGVCDKDIAHEDRMAACLPDCLAASTRGVDDDYRDAQIEAGAVAGAGAGAEAEGAAEARVAADADAEAEARQSYPNRRMRIEQKAFACENALLLLLLWKSLTRQECTTLFLLPL